MINKHHSKLIPALKSIKTNVSVLYCFRTLVCLFLSTFGTIMLYPPLLCTMYSFFREVLTTRYTVHKRSEAV